MLSLRCSLSYRAIPLLVWLLFVSLIDAQDSGSVAESTQDPLPINPAFAQNLEVWISPVPRAPGDDGTQEAPFGVGGVGEFDRFMAQFSGMPNLTFRLTPGLYETAGSHEVLPGRGIDPSLWEPASGWRILGASAGNTTIRLTSITETQPTKYYVLGNVGTAKLITHFEMAHLTLDANGVEMSRQADSGFCCAYIVGSFVQLHHLRCIGGFNALSPQAAHAATHREIFLLGISGTRGFSVTNNVIDSCTVQSAPGSPKAFPGAIQGLTTSIINGANIDPREGTDDLAYSPRISRCVVDGLHPSLRTHGLTMCGSFDGVVRDNLVMNSTFGFYSDDARRTADVHIIGNHLSNTVSGVYLNYSGQSKRWDSLAVLSNIVELCRECTSSDQPNRPAQGINLVGATSPFPGTFGRTVVAGNSIMSVDGPLAGRVNDYGIQLTYHERALVAHNRISVFRARNSMKLVWSAGMGEQYWFSDNLTHTGLPLIVHDRTRPECASTDTYNITPCAYDGGFPWNEQAQGEFTFASVVPELRPFPTRPAMGPMQHLFWTVEQTRISPAYSVAEAGEQGPGFAFNSVPDRGFVEASVYVTRESEFWLWLRSRVLDRSTGGLFDVEIDGERRFFGIQAANRSTNWVWRLTNERVPVANTNRVRAITLSQGWHTVRVWARNTNVQLSSFFLTTAHPTQLAPNDQLVRRLRAPQRSTSLVSQPCPWEAVLDVRSGSITPPMALHEASHGSQEGVAFSDVADRGQLELRMHVPRTQDYTLGLLMAPSPINPSHDTMTLLLDGREWIVVSEPGGAPRWTRRMGRSEAEARAASTPTPTVRLNAGWHRFILRARHPSVALGSIALMAVD